MIIRKVVPRLISLFEFFEGSELTLTVETGERAHKKPYAKLYVEGHTLYKNINLGGGRAGSDYPEFVIEEDTLLRAVRKFVDLIEYQWIMFGKKQVVKVPQLSRHVDSVEGFSLNRVQKPKAIHLFEFVDANQLTLTILTGEDAFGAKTVQASIEGYGIGHRNTHNELAYECKSSEAKALKELVTRISNRYIAPCYYTNGCCLQVDNDKKIRVPALHTDRRP